MQLPHISRLSLPDVSEAISGPMGERSERTQPDASEAITLSTPLGPDRVAILHAIPRVGLALLIAACSFRRPPPVAARRERSDQRARRASGASAPSPMQAKRSVSPHHSVQAELQFLRFRASVSRC